VALVADATNATLPLLSVLTFAVTVKFDGATLVDVFESFLQENKLNIETDIAIINDIIFILFDF
jgi:hypothetical protein